MQLSFTFFNSNTDTIHSSSACINASRHLLSHVACDVMWCV